jgi:geranylgeranyl diphosphate synthase type II
LIHTYSLVHDDLPAMDDDTLRRGRPTSHVVFGEGQAILAGDALLTEAFGLMSREPSDEESDAGPLAARKLHAIRIVAEAAGACGMVGGQAIDLEATGPGATLDGRDSAQ